MPIACSTPSPRIRRIPGDLIVIDFGTATTFDVVDYSGAYKGGIITPGINLSLDALVAAAAKLPRIAIEEPQGNLSVIGRTTEDQMHIGIYWGYVAMMEGLTQRLKAEIGRPAKVISTGALRLCSINIHRSSTRLSRISPSRARSAIRTAAHLNVMPAKAGIQAALQLRRHRLDPSPRWGDD